MLATPKQAQDQLLANYKLDENHTYYEAVRGRAGLIEFSDDNRPLLERVTRLCEAVRPTDPDDKTRLLKQLLSSEDPVLKIAAERAIENLR